MADKESRSGLRPVSDRHLRELVARIIGGEQLSLEEALELADKTGPEELWAAADELRRRVHGDRFDYCSIINARSGKCSENCRFCAQSSRYQTAIETYDRVDYQEVRRQALENESHGVERFSLVTAGREVAAADLDAFATMYERLGEETGLSLCASMGFLTPEKARRLVDAGVRRYHCNLETCRSFFAEVCTTHSWQDKVETIKIARQAGMDICSGGIIGLGESFRQRLELAVELRDLGVLSIPINILTPIPGTPLAERPELTIEDVLTAIALFRLTNPAAVIRLAGGRARFGVGQYRFFLAGANGAIVGNYLTTAGNSIAEDIGMIESLGYRPMACNKE
ncbi:MAG: biotin synthase BioB [Desulfobulbaceae bacterium]|uniref:Biotin synthase n=1 Tax=Desulfofustis glycolicus DSM 9705 TaxID=1121409 RepID=A0A1M5X971_9BACT|nr:biotin synthase BioB [Desulfobulbaceae bacterium]SHH96387.1 biotin synthase [Desulfofustis glycolicus DSM 9705]